MRAWETAPQRQTGFPARNLRWPPSWIWLSPSPKEGKGPNVQKQESSKFQSKGPSGDEGPQDTGPSQEWGVEGIRPPRHKPTQHPENSGWSPRSRHWPESPLYSTKLGHGWLSCKETSRTGHVTDGPACEGWLKASNVENSSNTSEKSAPLSEHHNPVTRWSWKVSTGVSHVVFQSDRWFSPKEDTPHLGPLTWDPQLTSGSQSPAPVPSCPAQPT